MLIVRFKRCERALAGGRLDEAAKLLLPPDARAHRRGQELVDELVGKLLARGRAHLAAGRSGPAYADWQEAVRLAGNTLEVANLRDEIERAGRSAPVVAQERREAVTVAREAPAARPATSPLGSAYGAAQRPVAWVPGRFLLHVDGAGSYVVLQPATVRVGAPSGAHPPELPLVMAPTSSLLTLVRCDEDYFLNAPAVVPVNGRGATNSLLASGDRIDLGPRCRLQFRRPNAASASAVLRLSGARLPWGGVREVVLMDRELVIGDSAAAHVRSQDCRTPVILQAARDAFVCRADETVRVDGQARGRMADVTDGARVAVGELSFVICRA